MNKERKEELKKNLKKIVVILNRVWKKFIGFIEIVPRLIFLLFIVLYIGALLYRIFTAKDLFTILVSILFLLIPPFLYYAIRYFAPKQAKLKQFFSKILSIINQTQSYVPLALVVLILIFSSKLDLFLKLGRTFLIIKIVEIAFASLLAVSLSLFLYFDEPIKRLLRKNKTMICTDFLMSFIALWSVLYFQNEDWIIFSLLFLFILAMNYYLFSEKEIPKDSVNSFRFLGVVFFYLLFFSFFLYLPRI